MTYEVFVISNSDLFREGLNAVAAFCSSPGFKAATWIGSAIGIIMTAAAYVKQHDVMLCLKWLVTYFFVFNILLGVPSTVAVINTSDQTVPAQVVDNVPFGIAFPAHLFTAFGYGFSSDLETVFALPNEEQYHKTGMLFGSNLFRLSLASQLDDPEIMNEMNSYVRSCVVGDILINHKYTFNDLLHSENIWAKMTSNPSPIRGLFIDGNFQTCSQAAPLLTRKINQYSAKTAPAILARFIPTRNTYAPAAINNMLASSYQYFKSASKTGTDILRQNIAINVFRSGLKNYAAETGSVAGLENIANTMAMNNTRMAWATSQHIGIQTLPLMQVVLLLLLICIFPLIAVLTLVPGLGFSVFKNYLYSLLWLETWPIMYAILNMAMNFYLSAGKHGTVTLANINLLAQEHSDIAGIAGYLVLAIPFLSLGIVKGMAFTFNNAAQYLGGMIHSIAQGSGASVATGNYSLGNVSTDNATANNLSANKHDTNYTSLHGLNTQQLGNAATVTATPMGYDVYSTAQGMSQLATSAYAAQSAANSISQQVDRSLTSAVTHNVQYAESKAHNDALGSNHTSGISTQLDHAMSTIHNVTNSLANKEHINTKESLQRMAQASGMIEAHVSDHATIGVSLFGNGAGVSIGTTAKVGASGQITSSHDGSYSVDADKNISASDVRDFRNAWNVISSYSNTHSYSKHNADAKNLAIQMGSDLNNAERLSSSAQFIRTHSDVINTNFSQSFANYVQSHHPEEASAILTATGSSPLLAKQQHLADQFIQTHAKQLASQYSSDSADVARGLNSPGMQQRQNYAMQNYQNHSQNIMSKGSNLGVNTTQAQIIQDSLKSHLKRNQRHIDSGRELENEQQVKLQNSTNDRINKGKSYAQKGVTTHIVGGIIDEVKEHI